MRSKLNMTVSMLGLLMLTGLMSACAARVVGSCPVLAPPPLAAVDALQGANDANVDAWAVALDRHYDKLAVCAART